jgi:DNA polymerase-3 subunit gamma/tau
MSYQVLARKWRPRRFGDLVGQGHVVRALVNALDHDRLHHAFLFTGTRGVGKTTIARILAKSLNCESGVSSQPCGQCRACVEVDEGRFVDLIEVDAASRTKVDDTRELLDNVQYAPTRGRYKVYLIDEVHMLSGHSFNALLKTLEEPPPHVKFLLATTDPQKLPVTVLSRCLQFSLKRLQPEQIAAQLEKILQAEALSYDTASLKLLARSADGSMRDSLSLLDQAIAFGGGKVTEGDVREMLGSIDQKLVVRLLDALAGGDAAAVLRVVADAAETHGDYDTLLQDLLLALHRVSLAQVAPEVLEALGEERAHYDALARAITPEDVQLYYQIGLMGRRDLSLAPEARSGLEMVLLRMLAFRPVATPADDATPTSRAGGGSSRERSPGVVPAPATGVTVPAVAPRVAPAVVAATVAPPPAPAVPATSGADVSAPGNAEDWAAWVARLKLTGLTRELAQNSALDRWVDDQLHLTLDAACAHLLSKEREQALREALEAGLGRVIGLRIRVGSPQIATPAKEKVRVQEERQQAAAAAIAADPNVRVLQETFNARVSPGSIRPKL